MLPQGLKKASRQFGFRLFALARSALIEMFGGQDHHHNSGPVSDRVAEERADVAFLVTHAVEHNPGQQDATGHNRKSVTLKERLVRFLLQSKLQILHLIPALLVRRHSQIRSGLSASIRLFWVSICALLLTKTCPSCPIQRDG